MRKTVLVAVLKSREDLRLLTSEKWYRIPLAFLPKRKFTYLAFYQPRGFGREGKRIAYYARVAKREFKKRIKLLPNQPLHPRAQEEYLKCSFRTIEKLQKPIRNIIPRRVSFGFTTFRTLRGARDILELYGVPKTEEILKRRLAQLGVPFASEYGVSHAGKRYRADLAILCRCGKIAIECDNDKAHTGRVQRARDRRKDAALRRLGWRVLRFREGEIIEQPDGCALSIRSAIASLGGIFGTAALP